MHCRAPRWQMSPLLLQGLLSLDESCCSIVSWAGSSMVTGTPLVKSSSLPLPGRHPSLTSCNSCFTQIPFLPCVISAAVSRCLKHCPRLPPLQAGNQGLCFSPDSRGLLFVAPVSCWPQRRRAERSRVGPTESQGPGGLHALSPDEPLEAEISDCHPAVMQSPTRASKITDGVLLCSGLCFLHGVT